MPEYNKYNQKGTNKKPCFVLNVVGNTGLLVPLSTKSNNREEYQQPYDTGSGKLSWLQLNSVTQVTLTNQGYLQYWYVTLVEKLPKWMCLQMQEEVLNWKQQYPYYSLTVK
jgi:hypothetical protein